jgi:hypothetical protein
MYPDAEKKMPSTKSIATVAKSLPRCFHILQIQQLLSFPLPSSESPEGYGIFRPNRHCIVMEGFAGFPNKQNSCLLH